MRPLRNMQRGGIVVFTVLLPVIHLNVIPVCPWSSQWMSPGMYLVYLTMPSVARNIQSCIIWWWVNSELEGTWRVNVAAFAVSKWTCRLPNTGRPDRTAMFGVLDDVWRHNSSSRRRNRCPVYQFRAELMQPRIPTIDNGRTYLCLCNICVRTCMHLNHVFVCSSRSRVFVRWSRTEIWLGLIASICQYVLLLLFTFSIIIWWYDIFVNCNWVVTRWRYYVMYLHTNNT